MSLFLLTFFGLYSALHLYLFIKIRSAFAPGALDIVSILLFMALMVSAPVLIRVSERCGYDMLARIMAYIGYSWMGVAFLFFSFSFTLDVVRFFAYVGGHSAGRNLPALILSPRIAFVVAALATAAIVVYGSFEARNIQNDTLIIPTPKIPKEIGTLTIAQISDVHLGLIVRHDRLHRILDKVREADPDIVVSTGDLVDGQMCNVSDLLPPLKAIQPRFGKFAVTGNHEFYAGLDQAMAFTREAGFTVLRGQAATVDGIITIAGVDDIAGKRTGQFVETDERVVLSQYPRSNYTLLLKHRPVVDHDSAGLFDLQLSGHTHNGQFFPFSLVTRLVFTNHAGLSRIDQDGYLYVNRGSGTWGPPIRFMARPEVTIIKLVHSENAEAPEVRR